jgi:tetratricopeptide (TPR) repeat protein
MVGEGAKASAQHRLTSWKEIASFLGRDERTAKRWEATRGLPVRRIPGTGRSSVFAYAEEIEAWMRTGASQQPAYAEPPEETAKAETRTRTPWLRVAAATLIGGAVLVAALAIYEFGLVSEFEPGHPATHIPDRAAAEFYRSGMHAWQTRTPAGLSGAIADFNLAVTRDPRYAAAYVGLADAYNLEAEFTSMPSNDAYPRAADAAKRAIALDPSLAAAHAALAFTDFYRSRDAPTAEREFRRALALDPSSATAHHWYATFLMTMGRADEALAQIDKAESLDSESSAIPADKALILFHEGRKDDAIKLLTRIEDEQPDFASPHSYLAAIWLNEDNDLAYLREMRLAAQARHDPTEETLAEAGATGLASGGHSGMLRAILDVERKLYAAGKLPAYSLAIICAKLGDTKDAIDYLAASVARHESNNIAVGIEPDFAVLRSDTHFAALLERAEPKPSL